MSEKVCKTTGKDVKFSHGGAGRLNVYERCDGAKLDETMVIDREEWDALHTEVAGPTPDPPQAKMEPIEPGPTPDPMDRGDSHSTSLPTSSTESGPTTPASPGSDGGDVDPTGASVPSSDDTNVPRG